MIDHLSYSSITTYLSCPMFWRMKYLDKQPTYSTPELAFGKAFHETVQGHLATQAPLAELWPAAWVKNAEDQSIFWGAGQPASFQNEGLRMFAHGDIQRGMEAIRAQYDGGAIEKRVELHVPGVPVPVVGYIDVTLQGGKIADFKTSSRSWSQDRAQGELQSLFYLAALDQAGERGHGWKFTHFVFVKTKTPQFQAFTHRHNGSECAWLMGMIYRVWQGIECGVFPENPGAWRCGTMCDFWSKCRGRYV